MRTVGWTRSMTRWMLATALFAVAVLAVGSVPSAYAANPPLVGQFPEDGLPGSGAGRLSAPYGIAPNPTTGHIFVSDSRNNRVSEFTAWGPAAMHRGSDPRCILSTD